MAVFVGVVVVGNALLCSSSLRVAAVSMQRHAQNVWVLVAVIVFPRRRRVFFLVEALLHGSRHPHGLCVSVCASALLLLGVVGIRLKFSLGGGLLVLHLHHPPRVRVSRGCWVSSSCCLCFSEGDPFVAVVVFFSLGVSFVVVVSKMKHRKQVSLPPHLPQHREKRHRRLLEELGRDVVLYILSQSSQRLLDRIVSQR